MKRSVEIYALVVCFFALSWFTVTTGTFLYQLVRVTFPEVTVPSSPYPAEQLASSLATSPVSSAQKNVKPAMPSPAGKTAEQMRAVWNANYQLSLQQERKDAIQKSIRELIMLLVSGVVFIFHWRLVRSERLTAK